MRRRASALVAGKEGIRRLTRKKRLGGRGCLESSMNGK